MHLVRHDLAKLQEYISKEESDEKEGKKIPEKPSYENKHYECDDLLDDGRREYDGKEPWDGYHTGVVKNLP